MCATDDGVGSTGTVARSSLAPIGDQGEIPAGARGTASTRRSAGSHADAALEGPATGVPSRDRKVFIQLLREHDHRLRALAYSLLGDRDLMDDVLQDVYVKAFLALPRLRRRSAAGTWLYRVTYTTCIDVLRRQRRLTVVPAEVLAELPDPAPDPGAALAERDRLSAALDRLPPEQRAAVLLVDREGFDYRAVAEILDIPFGTAASRVHTARRALRRALGSPAAEGSS